MSLTFDFYFKIFAIILLLLGTLLSGCADRAYEANMRYRDHRAMYRYQSQADAASVVMKAISSVTSVMESELQQRRSEDVLDKLVATATKMDSNSLGMVLLARVATAMTDNQAKAEMVRARVRAIEYLQPIFEAIYKEETERIGTPATWEDVALKAVGYIPIMTSVAGMYGLGREAVKNAGEHISASLSDSSHLNIRGVAVHDSAGSAVSFGSQTGASASAATTTTTDSHNTGPEPVKPEPEPKELTWKELMK